MSTSTNPPTPSTPTPPPAPSRPNSEMVFSLPNDQDIKDAFSEQRKPEIGWDLYAERQLLENVVNQRVNFVIAIFALFLTAAATVESKTNLIIVLILGALMLFALTITTIRVYLRLDIVLRMLYKLGDKHVLVMVREELPYRGKIKIGRLEKKVRFGPMIKKIYVYIPAICTFILFLGFILACCGCIKPGGGDQTINNFYYYDSHRGNSQ